MPWRHRGSTVAVLFILKPDAIQVSVFNASPYSGHPRDVSQVDCVWNVMAYAQKPDFVFRRNGGVHLNRRGPQFSRLLAAEVCASAVVMLDTPCSEVVWRLLAIQSIRQFPLHFPSRASPCAITFQLDCTTICTGGLLGPRNRLDLIMVHKIGINVRVVLRIVHNP